MKKILFCLLTIFACFGLFAQQQPVVAVAPFDAISGISATEANLISRAFNIRLGNTHKVILVDRDIVERIILEHSFQTGDWSNQQKTAELGKALNANWIVRGNFERFGNNVLFTVSFYDIATFQFRGGDEVRVANADAAYDQIPKMVDNLITVIERAGSIPVVTNPARPVSPAGKTYNIGDVGPAGGIIFHDRGFIADGWRYLEAAPAGTDFSAPGHPSSSNITGRGTIVGSGKRNTQILVDNLNRVGRDYAAQICVTIDINGFTDWFIPSRDELNLMYQNLHRRGLGGFSGFEYWSSSKGDDDRLSRALDFSSGNWVTSANTSTRRTRAIRSF